VQKYANESGRGREKDKQYEVLIAGSEHMIGVECKAAVTLEAHIDRMLPDTNLTGKLWCSWGGGQRGGDFATETLTDNESVVP